MVRTEAKKAFIKQIKDEARAAHTIAALYGMGALTDKQLVQLCVGNFAQGLGAISVIKMAWELKT